MKKEQANEVANKIYGSIVNRLQELQDRCFRMEVGDAYLLAFQIGLTADIADELKKVRKIK